MEIYFKDIENYKVAKQKTKKITIYKCDHTVQIDLELEDNTKVNLGCFREEV